ncbi:MAG: hypothetical protein PUF50_08280 [Erysipelotrichaceae bacterium]|nr:hypothetical protein [Erysipelotrichaceae bacterium]
MQSLQRAIEIVENSKNKCIRMQGKFAEGTSHHTLLKNRIHALDVVSCLMQENHDLCLDDLTRAVAPIESIIHKTQKARSKYPMGTKQYQRFTPLIDAMVLAREYLIKEIESKGR